MASLYLINNFFCKISRIKRYTKLKSCQEIKVFEDLLFTESHVTRAKYIFHAKPGTLSIFFLFCFFVPRINIIGRKIPQTMSPVLLNSISAGLLKQLLQQI